MPTVGYAGRRWNWVRVFGPDSLMDPDGAAPLLDEETRPLFRATASSSRCGWLNWRAGTVLGPIAVQLVGDAARWMRRSGMSAA